MTLYLTIHLHSSKVNTELYESALTKEFSEYEIKFTLDTDSIGNYKDAIKYNVYPENSTKYQTEEIDKRISKVYSSLIA